MRQVWSLEGSYVSRLHAIDLSGGAALLDRPYPIYAV
jgi:hypothetical protein